MTVKNITLKDLELTKTKLYVSYPKLMVSKMPSKVVVLFDSSKSGQVVSQPDEHNYYYIGEYRTDWIPETFEDYNEPVVLKNIVLNQNFI